MNNQLRFLTLNKLVEFYLQANYLDYVTVIPLEGLLADKNTPLWNYILDKFAGWDVSYSFTDDLLIINFTDASVVEIFMDMFQNIDLLIYHITRDSISKLGGSDLNVL